MVGRRLEFWRASVGLFVLVGETRETWTAFAFSFSHPIGESVLLAKLEAAVENQGAEVIGSTARRGKKGVVERSPAYEMERVGSSEARGLGFYRWVVLDEKDAEVERIRPFYVMRSDGSEVRWRR